MSRKRTTLMYLPNQLQTCTHAWLRVDPVRKPFEAPYKGPFKVLSRTADAFQLLIRDHPTFVSIDRIKPSVLPISEETVIQFKDDPDEETSNPESTEPAQQEHTTRSGRHVRFRKDVDFQYD